MDRSSEKHSILQEDTCEFSIYSDHDQLASIEIELKLFWTSSHLFNHRQSKDTFIWHSGNIPQLSLGENSRLNGSLHYGDSVQDEWFLVWCLYEISKKFGCLIQVFDNDGEFLLIEAADHLPKWVTPDLAKGRVWILSGSLHLIPLEASPLDHTGPLQISIALEIIRNSSYSTIASQAINSAILARIQKASPQQLSENHLFNTEAYLHPNIASALQNDPNLIGLAVKAFCDKTPDTFKACRDMIHFPPQPTHLTPRKDSLVTASNVVRMTRPLYAVLLNHEMNFHPPRPFEKARWMACDVNDTPEWKKRTLGMKISCGFEMMLFTAESSLSASSKTFITTTHSSPYQSYLQKLQKSGYFQDETEGSQKWTQLESMARETYLRTLKPSEILDRYQRAVVQVCEGTKLASSHILQGENDEWLNLDEEQLKLFLKTSGEAGLPGQSIVNEEELAKGDVQKMTSFADQIQNFVDGQGSLEGALHSDDEITEDGQSDSQDDSEQEQLRADIFKTKRKGGHGSRSRAPINYDDKTNKILETLVPPLSPSEWGQSTQTSTSTSKKVDSNLSLPSHVLDNSSSNNTHKALATREQSSPSMRKMTKFEPQAYDGVCEDFSEEEEDDDHPNPRTDLHMERTDMTEIIDDIDMDNERDDFLKFAREALGLTDDQYAAILEDRKERGAYVPPSPIQPDSDDNDSEIIPEKSLKSSQLLSLKKKQDCPEDGPRSLSRIEGSSTSKASDGGFKSIDLQAFDDLMDRMNAELRQQIKQLSQKCKKGGPIPDTTLGPSLTRADDLSDSDSEPDTDAIDQAMQHELAKLMKQSGVDLDGESNTPMDYGLISHFLESFKSQAGLPGPVGNMAGRIGFDLLGKENTK
ncbi:hypothetical protein O181_013534 [Austropuccinia psidii MF-1]|uniref:Protein SGT1 n=1 Tax=Austropuccinia psidii MF-1 TaxID=1389203 RepID=A0A9Q3BWK9_9BASI|nr:hypothetical protein [Austropuccinia psidii MF-1]